MGPHLEFRQPPEGTTDSSDRLSLHCRDQEKRSPAHSLREEKSSPEAGSMCVSKEEEEGPCRVTSSKGFPARTQGGSSSSLASFPSFPQ